MYSGGYSSYKRSSGADKKPSSSYSSASSSYSPASSLGRYGIRSSSSVPYGAASPSYSVPLSSSTLSALALSSISRYSGSKSASSYSPASSASSSPRLTSYHPSSSVGGLPSSLAYSRSFTRASDGYGSWSVRICARLSLCPCLFAFPASPESLVAGQQFGAFHFAGANRVIQSATISRRLLSVYWPLFCFLRVTPISAIIRWQMSWQTENRRSVN